MSRQCAISALPVAANAGLADRLASLFDAHYDRLYRLARRLAPSADDALDLVQETFLKAARRPKSIPVGSSNEEAWLVLSAPRRNNASFAGLIDTRRQLSQSPDTLQSCL